MDSTSTPSSLLSSSISLSSLVSSSPWLTDLDNLPYSRLFNCTNEDLVNSGFYRTKCYTNIVCCGCGWESGNTNLSIRHLNFVHKMCNPDCKMSEYFDVDHSNYMKNKKSISKTEEIMKETYLIWPKSYPKVEDMIKTGFYYIGVDDATACISCGVVLEHWGPDDVPEEEHKKASPQCEIFQ
jgi:hypothetical protein